MLRREPYFTHFPGDPDLKIAFVHLTQSQVQESTSAALKRFRDLDIPVESLEFRDEFAGECVVQLLLRAMRDAEDLERPIAISADDIRDNITVNERDCLADMYAEFENEENPREGLEPAELDEMMDLVKKKEHLLLSLYGSFKLSSLAISMASQPSILAQSKSSISERSSQTPPDSEPISQVQIAAETGRATTAPEPERSQ